MAKKQEQKMKMSKTIGSICPSEFDGKIDDIIAKLNEYKSKYNEYEELIFSYECRGYPEDGYDFILYGERMETDEEYEKRIDQLKELDKKKKEAEYEEYLRLKKKYEEC